MDIKEGHYHCEMCEEHCHKDDKCCKFKGVLKKNPFVATILNKALVWSADENIYGHHVTQLVRLCE